MYEQPKIFVSAVPDDETTCIPSDAIDLTSGTMGYMVNDSIDGLSRPDADVLMSRLAAVNASRMSGAFIFDRTISMDIIALPDTRIHREQLYNILSFGETRRFYVVTGSKVVYIDGIVEKLNGAFKSNKLFRFGLSILCPFPWFQSVELHTMKLVVGENTIRYSGDVPAGWELDVPRQVSPPLVGAVGDLSVEIGGETFAYSGNVSIPYICTVPRKRAFNGYRKASSGSTTGTFAPAFGSLVKGSAWPLITRDTPTVTISCSSSTQEFFEQQNIFSYRDTFSGV